MRALRMKGIDQLVKRLLFIDRQDPSGIVIQGNHMALRVEVDDAHIEFFKKI